MTRGCWQEAMETLGLALQPNMLWRQVRDYDMEVRLDRVETERGGFTIRHSLNLHDTHGTPLGLFLQYWEPVVK